MMEKATTNDGSQIAYMHRAGRGARVALLHSLAMDHSFWNSVTASLPEDFAIIAIDARGHGQSDKPAGPYSVDLFADDLASVFADADWASGTVVGASMGGSVSLAFGARHPQRVDGLVLIDTTACYGDGAIVAWEERGQKAVAGGMKALAGFQAERWFSDSFRETNPTIVKESLDVFFRNDPTPYLETCRMLGHCDLRNALPGFEFPVAIVVGEEDYATPVEMAEAMHAAIPDTTLNVIDTARHYTPLEVPQLIADEITQVVARVA